MCRLITTVKWTLISSSRGAAHLAFFLLSSPPIFLLHASLAQINFGKSLTDLTRVKIKTVVARQKHENKQAISLVSPLISLIGVFRQVACLLEWKLINFPSFVNRSAAVFRTRLFFWWGPIRHRGSRFVFHLIFQIMHTSVGKLWGHFQSRPPGAHQ